ncbi:DEAD/DEAH box helicase [Occultella aeris]|uniref:Type III restriction enzyme, res subunit n=1 Tax=Occultella aeris TaxID=2761496 RepID=A0A7M4DHD2_9MICO|nr:DEAD/DEAH box helicase family protein [Occultella aeris]VZO36325.1 Type III restriction enzyme, res subunit [Occultella aeris]
MRYTLKEYQGDAVRDVLGNLTRARRLFHELGDTSQFALSATTGAGKTVMAAAAIEALFYGSDEHDFAPDPSAVVLWFSDDPSLNEQTRFRLMAASDRLNHSDLVVIEHPFSHAKLSPGKVYFLNTGKLTRSSLLTRGHDDDGGHLPGLEPSSTPDMQAYTIWDTLRNTIEDGTRTLYLVQDEAHRGFGTRASSEKPTIVRRLINGHAGVPPIPVVWGISATVKRFEDAMRSAEVSESRLALPKVVVDPVRVQESGLLKDTIALDIPAESGLFDTVLLTRATRKIIASTRAWAEYTATQDDGTTSSDPVVPLMVLQLPNRPDAAEVERALATVFETWTDLPADAVAHVLGEHRTERYGRFEVPYIAPERVQDATHVRVLLAKDAISTGWDCPRAEVLMSFRPAKDATHITQLLGRMVRTPLAMRIPGNDRLNTVECLLPHFNHKTATEVVEVLTGSLEDFPGAGGSGPRVLISPQEMTPNPTVAERVWEAFEELPSESVPRVGSKPVKRLTAFAQALTTDGLRPNAGKDAHAELHAVLDGCAARYRDKVEAAVREVWTVHGETITGQTGATTAYEKFAETADDRAIQAAFREAGRAFSPALAGTYVDHLAGPEDPETGEDGLRDAHVKVAALALVPEVVADLEREATNLTGRWFGDYRVAIKDLTDERQAVYNDIRAMSVEPQRMMLTRPRNSIVETKTQDAVGDEISLPTRTGHLLSDQDGNYPLGEHTSIELEVLTKEMGRPGALAWYRNPGRASQDSLGVAWQDGPKWRSLRPDFLFFTEQAGQIRVSIVDPHSHHLRDALPKLRGMAKFAAEYGDEFHRIESLTTVDGQTRVLDVKDPHVRAAILAADDAKALYLSNVAGNY